MKNIFLKFLVAAFVATIFIPTAAIADEGMWLVNMFETIYPQMKKAGLKLQPGEIYNAEGESSIADAIVSLDFGCTGSMISKNGLMITNHHCAYGDIHSLSTAEHNYLEEGFWAMNSLEEKPIKGKNALFLRKVIDVTAEVIAEKERVKASGVKGMVMRKVYRVIESKYSKDTDYEVMCASMWSGKKYFLFYYEVYPDVRLVGAPPVSIGAFGGETDNWGWPQHKGDFALYRVYADKEGKPAKYSSGNIPLASKKVLNIATKGVKEGDYTMVLGYPGSTNRYASSFEVKEKEEILNPIIVEARRGKLNIWEKHMNLDPAVRLLYADKYFGISNYADYAKWENKCFKMYNVKAIREAEEANLPEADMLMIDSLKRGYEAFAELTKDRAWFREAYIMASEWMLTVKRLNSIPRFMEKEGVQRVDSSDTHVKSALKVAKANFEGYIMDVDRELFEFNLGLVLKNLPCKYYSDTLKNWVKRYNGSAKEISNYIYSNSNFSSYSALEEFFFTSKSAEEIINDPAILFVEACDVLYFNSLEKSISDSLGIDISDFKIKYAHAIYNYRESKGIPQSPNANSTMRITYGTVGGIAPYDGIKYDYITTINGYREKEDANNYEFNVKPKMKALIEAKDWGRWGENGQLYVNFLTNNDITGGNSGSPVLNSKGEIIGLAFDGNRESISGDVYYHPDNFKTVCVDIRFVLWIIEKYADAGYLIDEMECK